MKTNDFYEAYYTRAIAAYNRGDLDGYFQHFSPAYIHHTIRYGREDTETLQQHRQGLADFLTSFPDASITLEEVTAQGTLAYGVVVYRARLSGTGKGQYRGLPADGKKVEMTGYLTQHILDGQVVEGWQLVDEVALLAQLGVIPALPTVPAE